MKNINKVWKTISTPIFFICVVSAIPLWYLWPYAHHMIYQNIVNDKNIVTTKKEKNVSQKNNPYSEEISNYGAFGDSYGSLTSLFASFAFIASLMALYKQSNQWNKQKSDQEKNEKINRAYAFYDEYNSVDMFQARTRSEYYLRFSKKNFYEISQTYFSDQSDYGKNAESIWPVMRFYQKVSKSFQYHQVDKSMVIDMFAENFLGWYFCYYKDRLIEHKDSSNWDAAKDLKKFFNEIEEWCINTKDKDKDKDKDKVDYSVKYHNWVIRSKHNSKNVIDDQNNAVNILELQGFSAKLKDDIESISTQIPILNPILSNLFRIYLNK